jgi:cell division protein FtsW
MENVFRGYIKYLLLAVVMLAIIMAQRDFGTTVTTGIVVIFMFFLGGVRWRYLFFTFLAAVPCCVYFLHEGYRLRRIFVFLDPWKDPYGSGFQLIQSLISFGAGGTFGKGLANGNQKLFYLPDAHTDFILSVIAEEFGLCGVWVVLLVFLLFLFAGVRIALRASDGFGFLLASGITILISLQVVLNIAVVMGALPTKGMVLPFLSYGGTALVVNLMAVGILLSVSRYCVMRSQPR